MPDVPEAAFLVCIIIKTPEVKDIICIITIVLPRKPYVAATAQKPHHFIN